MVPPRAPAPAGCHASQLARLPRVNDLPNSSAPAWRRRLALAAGLIAIGLAAAALWLQQRTRLELRDAQASAEEAKAAVHALRDAQDAGQLRLLLLQAPEVVYEWNSGFARAFVRSSARGAPTPFEGALAIHNRSARSLSALEVEGCFSLSGDLVALPYASVTGVCALKFKSDALGAGERATLDVTAAAASAGIDLGALSANDDARWEEALKTVRHAHQVFGPTLSQPGAETYSIPLWRSTELHATALYARIKVAYSVSGLRFEHILTLVTGVARRPGAARVEQLVDRVMKQPMSRIDMPPFPPLFVAFPQSVDNHDAAVVALLREAGLGYTIKVETDAAGHEFETGLVTYPPPP